MKMKYWGITAILSMLTGCAPSLIQRDVDKALNVGYEITKDKDNKIKKSTMKLTDSLTKKIITEKITEKESVKNLYLKIHVDELKWYCPDRSKIETEGFAVGLFGGLIGATIWGTKNFTTVYGISKVKVQANGNLDKQEVSCTDTINFKENYMNYSSLHTKKRAISEAFNKSLECILSELDKN